MLGLTTRRFDVAYCIALYLAISSCGTLILGGIPEGSATEEALGWTAYAAIMIAPVVLWRTRNIRAGPYLQAVFIFLAATAFVVIVVL